MNFQSSCQELVIDSKTNGRLTTQEINALVKKAEDMKLLDDKEEERLKMRNKLEGLCNSIKLEIGTGSTGNEKDLSEKVDKCKSWLTAHPGAKEAEYKAKLDGLLADKKLPPNQMPDNIDKKPTQRKKSTKITAMYCLNQGRQLLNSTRSDLTVVITHFRQGDYFWIQNTNNSPPNYASTQP